MRLLSMLTMAQMEHWILSKKVILNLLIVKKILVYVVQ